MDGKKHFITTFFRAWILLLNPPKSDKKNGKKGQLVRVSFFRSDFLQNPYFKRKFYVEINKWVKNNDWKQILKIPPVSQFPRLDKCQK